MPAETHRRHAAVDTDTVLDLIWSLASPSDWSTEPDPSLPLDQFDLDDEAAIFWLWDASAEEFADRTVAEPDFDELFAAETLGGLAEAIVRSLSPRSADLRAQTVRPREGSRQ